MARHHPNKEVSDAIEYALQAGWRMVASSGHVYCKLYCPAGQRGACIVKVASTPQNAGNHARRIMRLVDSCNCLPQLESET